MMETKTLRPVAPVRETPKEQPETLDAGYIREALAVNAVIGALPFVGRFRVTAADMYLKELVRMALDRITPEEDAGMFQLSASRADPAIVRALDAIGGKAAA